MEYPAVSTHGQASMTVHAVRVLVVSWHQLTRVSCLKTSTATRGPCWMTTCPACRTCWPTCPGSCWPSPGTIRCGQTPPTYGCVVLDEGFVKADSDYTGRALRALQELGFSRLPADSLSHAGATTSDHHRSSGRLAGSSPRTVGHRNPGASGSVNRLLRPDSVRHMSVTTAMQGLTAAHHQTVWDGRKAAREPGYAQARG